MRDDDERRIADLADGARSVCTSIGKLANTCGLITSVPSKPSSSV
jgi:hypothetical protein